ncbi:hypothetical protein IHE44_0009813 [Lamprotornis superbus]|uniref:Endonuclease 8-like 2 n=1 Tax=Lamprotornis superbus TaxID=245042 RepID=A0A835NKF0_9PASS|nr:hypothetical protein IHE44_0009813 [Lamprotornis superbus]
MWTLSELCQVPQSPVLSAVELKLSLWSVLVSGISLQRELALWDESQIELSLYTHSQQKSSEELQLPFKSRAECDKNLLIPLQLLEMPEGPSVRKFQLLISPFVGQVVVKVGGSSQKLNVNDLNALKLQDSQDEELQEPQHSRSEAPEAAEGRGNWLRVHFGMFGSVRANEFSRANKANKRGDWKDPVPRLVLHFESGGFLVFYNCRMLWCSSPRADPASDILSVEFHRGRALRALCAPEPICYTLLDQKYFSGLGEFQGIGAEREMEEGNIIKNEILYLARIHPLTPGSLLAVSDLERLLDCAVQFSSEWLHNKLLGQGLHPHVYQKEQCPLGHLLMKDTFGPSGGFKRLTWWCPQCQPAVLPEDGDPSPARLAEPLPCELQRL